MYGPPEKITDGVYLECGAFDRGEDTKTLEDYFGFSGILIEPIPEKFEILKKNRPDNECYNFAISNSNDDYVEFIGNNTASGIASTLAINNYQWLHDAKKYKVRNKKMKDILEESKFKYIDFMIVYYISVFL